jgi:hypothetical protein
VNTTEPLRHADIIGMNSVVCVCVYVSRIFPVLDLTYVSNSNTDFKEITLVQSPAFCNMITCVANHGGHVVYFDSVFPISYGSRKYV